MSEYQECSLHGHYDVDNGCPECEKIAERVILLQAWDRLGRAPDPLDPGFYVCNSIDHERWESLRRALFNESQEC